MSNVEISLPVRNRHNSFFYSHSYSNDTDLGAPGVSSKSGMDKLYVVVNKMTETQICDLCQWIMTHVNYYFSVNTGLGFLRRVEVGCVASIV